jgi:hypothetical protein
LPPDPGLPFIAYGSFQPDELGFGRIEPFLADSPAAVTIRATLYTRDGLPILQISKGTRAVFLLRFSAGSAAREAYGVIGGYEPDAHYQWTTVRTDDGCLANVLVARQPTHGAVEFEDERWTYRTDPVFLYVPGTVAGVIEQDAAKRPFEPAPAEDFDWSRLFRLEMAYMLLWMLLERFVSLRSGPLLRPMAKVRALAEYKEFRESLASSLGPGQSRFIYDSQNPQTRYTLDLDKPLQCANYYYGVRSNMAHRGKGAWRDGEIVRYSLIELFEITVDLLRAAGISAP